MLSDLIMNLVTASDPKDKEKAYRMLERVGVDRRSADAIVKECYSTDREESEVKRG